MVGSTFGRRALLIVFSLYASAAIALPARASLTWNWRYDAPSIVASGTFTTTGDADDSGFYRITGISGARNGARITALQPTGTPIPGNEPFAVDNLIRTRFPQLTKNGFGFAVSGGDFANPFYADFRSPPSYVEFFSTPPFTPPGVGPGDSELAVRFIATVPEPGTASVLGVAMIGLVAANGRRVGGVCGRRSIGFRRAWK